MADIKEKDDAHLYDEGAGGHGYDNEGVGEFKPLHRKLKSRHLQMIAIGGNTRSGPSNQIYRSNLP
jgi:amino acid transporter